VTVFDSFSEAGQLLAVKVRALEGIQGPVVIGLNARGDLVSRPLAESLDVMPNPVAILKSADGTTTTGLPDVRDRTVIVVDDGVESGTAARAVAPELRAAGAARLVFAVPVCPVALLAPLAEIYDELVVLHECADGHRLAGHYLDFSRLS